MNPATDNLTTLLDGTGLSALYNQPAPGAPLLILGHGAGAPLDHIHMNAIAAALAGVGIGTLRFNLPFMQAGKRRVDGIDVCLDTIDHAIATALRLSQGNELLLGGHSFGGRMATHHATRSNNFIKGLVLFSFPLHASGKPDTKRAGHLKDIQTPMLFLSGNRDKLAEPALLSDIIDSLDQATLHWLDTADHSFNILKRTRLSDEDVYAEAARTANTWFSSLQ